MLTTEFIRYFVPLPMYLSYVARRNIRAVFNIELESSRENWMGKPENTNTAIMGMIAIAIFGALDAYFNFWLWTGSNWWTWVVFLNVF